jgi:hypothetical protein
MPIAPPLATAALYSHPPMEVGNEVVLLDRRNRQITGALALATAEALIVHTLAPLEMLGDGLEVGARISARAGQVVATGIATRANQPRTVVVHLSGPPLVPDRRRHARVPVEVAVVADFDGTRVDGTTLDISIGGSRLVLPRSRALIGQRFELLLAGMQLPGVVVAGGTAEQPDQLRASFEKMDAETLSSLGSFVWQAREESGLTVMASIGARRLTWSALRSGAKLADGATVIAISTNTLANGQAVIKAQLQSGDGVEFEVVRRPNDVVTLAS